MGHIFLVLPRTAKNMDPISIMTVCKVSVNITAVNPPGIIYANIFRNSKIRLKQQNCF